MNKKMLTLLLAGLMLTSCTFSLAVTPPPTPTQLVIPTSMPPPTSPTLAMLTSSVPTAIPPTPIVNGNQPSVPTTLPQTNFCADPQVTALLQSFKSAVQTANGQQLASLVNPAHGMDVHYWRDGRVVNYDQTHARFLFETTYQVDWGPAAGSGQETIGSFHDVIVPSLHSLFDATSTTLVCNQIRTGGATYKPEWPYKNVNFYSIYYPGTDPNSSLDWQTWLTGVEYVQGKPYLSSIIHLQWEP